VIEAKGWHDDNLVERKNKNLTLHAAVRRIDMVQAPRSINRSNPSTKRVMNIVTFTYFMLLIAEDLKTD
jgi:hypothetical protein